MDNSSVYLGVEESLVDSLVPTGQQYQRGFGRQPFNRPLVQGSSLGAQANDPALTGQFRIADRRRKRGCLHDHSGTAAVGPVVYAPVVILTIITRIPEV